MVCITPVAKFWTLHPQNAKWLDLYHTMYEGYELKKKLTIPQKQKKREDSPRPESISRIEDFINLTQRSWSLGVASNGTGRHHPWDYHYMLQELSASSLLLEDKVPVPQICIISWIAEQYSAVAEDCWDVLKK